MQTYSIQILHFSFLAVESELAACSAAIKGDEDTVQLHKDSRFWLEHKD